MLGKLIKFEWRATYRLMAALNLALALLTVAGCCILITDVFGQEDMFPVAVLLMALYALSLTAFGLATMLYLYVRFYRNLFASEGYFMHTLPVTPMQLFHSKLAVGYVWMALSSVLVTFSILALLAAIFFHYAQIHGIEVLFQFLYGSGLPSLSSGNLFDPFYEKFGYTVGQFFAKFLLLHLASSFASLLTGYVSILLGQLVEKYKRAASVGFYIVIYVINQVVCSILMVIPTVQRLSGDSDKSFSHYFMEIMDYGTVSQFIMGALFYGAAVFLMRRRVNLD